MAAKKKAGSKKKTTASSSLPVRWEDRLKTYAAEESERVPVGAGNNISIRGGEFKYQGADLGESLSLIVLNHSFVNSYWDTPFDPDTFIPPTCMAASMKQSNMVPFDTVPEKQSDACAGCWANAFGSDQRGKAKACKNTVLLALIPGDADLDNLEDLPETAFMSVPPTSMPNWNEYAKKVTKTLKRPTWSVITKIAFDEKSDYEKLKFGLGTMIDDARLDVLEKIYNDQSIIERLTAAPSFEINEEGTEPRRKRGGGRGRPATKKKGPQSKKKARSKFSS